MILGFFAVNQSCNLGSRQAASVSACTGLEARYLVGPFTYKPPTFTWDFSRSPQVLLLLA
jgi:hypothetical protein